jgi:protein phosphatase PTC7
VKPIFQSEEQTKTFNFPFQIGSEGDPPQLAISLGHEVRDNDLIVLATDG